MARVLLIQCSIEAYANLLVALYNGLLNTFHHFILSLTQTAAINASDTLELHATLLMPNLARYSCVHASEMRKILPCFGPKDSVLYSCLHSSTTMTKFNIAESWWAWQWVNNATDPATATQLNLNWEPNKTHLHNVTYANNRVRHHLFSNHWHKTHIMPTRDVSSLNRSNLGHFVPSGVTF